MRYFEILTETVDEDRAIISLAMAIYSYIQKYDEMDNIPELINVGTIGQVFDTPLEILNSINIELRTGDGIINRLTKKKADPEDVIKEPSTRVVLGVWFPGTLTVSLNSDLVSSQNMKTTIAHELRHALDDFKSEFRASTSVKYATPKNKEHRKEEPHSKAKYLAQPAEINARFLEVLHSMVPKIRRAVRLPPGEVESQIMDDFNELLDRHHIAELFPEKAQSKQYKQLMKRGIAFIQKEIDHQANQIQSPAR